MLRGIILIGVLLNLVINFLIVVLLLDIVYERGL